MSDAAEFEFDAKEWERLLKRVRKKWDDIKERKSFGTIIAPVVFSDIIKHFEEEKGPDGKWAPWSKSYSEFLRDIGRSGNKKLQFSGRLRGSITPQSHRAAKDGILFYNNAKVQGSGFPYAYAHDNDDESRTQLPQRKFMWLSSEGMEKVIDVTEGWLSDERD